MKRYNPPYWVIPYDTNNLKPEYETNDTFMWMMDQLENEDPNFAAAIDWALHNDVDHLDIGFYYDDFVIAPKGYFEIDVCYGVDVSRWDNPRFYQSYKRWKDGVDESDIDEFIATLRAKRTV